MYKIAIIGHSPENLTISSEEKMRSSIKEMIDTLFHQYGSDVIFNIVGKVGVGLWAAEECLPKFTDYMSYYKYHLFLPFPQEITSEDWLDEQKLLLQKCCSGARAITICNSTKNISENGHSAYKEAINDSNFVVFFWTGARQGDTFDSIKYALANNKMSINALKDLKLITNKDIKK